MSALKAFEESVNQRKALLEETKKNNVQSTMMRVMMICLEGKLYINACDLPERGHLNGIQNRNNRNGKGPIGTWGK